jgi:hypothetical protein
METRRTGSRVVVAALLFVTLAGPACGGFRGGSGGLRDGAGEGGGGGGGGESDGGGLPRFDGPPGGGQERGVEGGAIDQPVQPPPSTDGPDGGQGDRPPAGDGPCGRACCRNEDCPAMAGRTASCDVMSGTCRYTCAGDTVDCRGKCIARTACCTDRDCPMQNTQVGKCDEMSNQCSWACGGATPTPCAGRCIPMGGCCEMCPGNFACVNNVCSTTMCREPYVLSGSTCVRTCPGCNTSPHCDATNANVVTGRCDTATGMCSTTTTTACTGGRVCQSGQCECPTGRTWNGSSCVFTCPSCNTSPHCENNNVVVGQCNTGTGACTKPVMMTCSGGRTCQGNQCVCTDGRTWNGSACVLTCPTCNTNKRCSGNTLILTERCNTSTGMCEPMTQNCGTKGCNSTRLECNVCNADSDCGLCKRCNAGQCENWDDDPKCGEIRPGSPDPIKTCRDCRAGSCVPVNPFGVCESGGGFCNSQGRCQYCGTTQAGEAGECCPSRTGLEPCGNEPGCGFDGMTQNMCTCNTNDRCVRTGAATSR